jgi:hypothetical protein
MSIAPFSPHPVPTHPDAQGGWWRTRLAVFSATVGIAATLLAYAISPGLRHAVTHAEHSVSHAVSRVFDRDAASHKAAGKVKPANARHAKHSASKHATSPAGSPTSQP